MKKQVETGRAKQDCQILEADYCPGSGSSKKHVECGGRPEYLVARAKNEPTLPSTTAHTLLTKGRYTELGLAGRGEEA